LREGQARQRAYATFDRTLEAPDKNVTLKHCPGFPRSVRGDGSADEGWGFGTPRARGTSGEWLKENPAIAGSATASQSRLRHITALVPVLGRKVGNRLLDHFSLG
jgi:hypothetical protein